MFLLKTDDERVARISKFLDDGALLCSECCWWGGVSIKKVGVCLVKAWVETISGCFDNVFPTRSFITDSQRVKALLWTAAACSVTSLQRTSRAPAGPCWDMKVPTRMLENLAASLPPPPWGLGIVESYELSPSSAHPAVSGGQLGAVSVSSSPGSGQRGLAVPAPLLFAQGAGAGR